MFVSKTWGLKIVAAEVTVLHTISFVHEAVVVFVMVHILLAMVGCKPFLTDHLHVITIRDRKCVLLHSTAGNLIGQISIWQFTKRCSVHLTVQTNSTSLC